MTQQADAFVGLRVPEPIKKQWQEQADREHRSLSNWIVLQLTRQEEEPSSKRPERNRKKKQPAFVG